MVQACTAKMAKFVVCGVNFVLGVCATADALEAGARLPACETTQSEISCGVGNGY